MYNIAICDDSKEYLNKIRETIWKNPEYNPDLMTVYMFESGEAFLQENTARFQLVFLDMQMGKGNGEENTYDRNCI